MDLGNNQTDESPQSGIRASLAVPVRLAVGLALLGYVLSRADWTQISSHVRNADWFFLVMFLAITPVNVSLCVVKWKLLLAVRGYKISFIRLFSLYILGQFYNHLMPTSVGGDMVRAITLQRKIASAKHAFGSIVVERFTGMTVLVALGLAALLISEPLRQHPLILALVAASTLAYLVILLAIVHPLTMALLHNTLGRLKFMAGVLAKLERFQQSLHDYRRYPGVLLGCLVLSILFYAGAILNVYFACRTFGESPPFVMLSAIVPVVMIVAMLPVTINGIGLAEWGYVTTFTALGLAPAIGLTAALLIRIKQILWSSLGYFVHLVTDVRARDREKSPSKQKTSPPTHPLPIKDASAAEPIFLFGCARSGTSLLSRMIGSHPRIAIPYESHFYNTFYPWLQYYGDLTRADVRARLIDDILSTDVLHDWKPTPSKKQVLDAIQRFDFHGIVDAIMRVWVLNQGKVRWGDKTPAHVFYWPVIHEGFPNARVIHIVRDGRDVALSWCRSRFGPKHIYPLAVKWVHYLQTVEQLRSHLPANAFHEIRYEDLLANPKRVLGGICEFLQEEYSAQMLNFHESPVDYKTDRRNLENLNKPLLKNNCGKWHKEMTTRQLRIFEAVAGSMLEKHGYTQQLTDPRISTIQAMRYQYLEHPPRKALAMLKNTKGHVDGLRRMRIYTRLRFRSLLQPNR